MRIKVNNAKGLIVLCGKLKRSTFGSFPSGEAKGVYEIVTTNPEWTDPTGEKGANQVLWRVLASGIHAFRADPNDPPRSGYLVVEGVIMPSYQDQPFHELWRTKNGRPRKTIRLKASYVKEPDFPSESYLEMSDPMFSRIYHRKNALKHSVTYYPQGATFDGWWHSEYESKYRTEPETDDDEFFYDE